eukprot:CAMPEP_0117039066 /NCGR_PEP_ID=MMETSP0472-20121206/27449_1 /TAXON_ID=693140 ORGANISM="Tiarina fusus, Strain LIS" /NCGR_SAMPLE_ID=MMETSP0472 /ASSEMBLY_ACC=CAM_ASM_000603 /LENGTH=367 /DNA_ID=CAMNT_0004749469 /DNA_START=99 /DNA_END=1202 /DNA_ORIENTATION=-
MIRSASFFLALCCLLVIVHGWTKNNGWTRSSLVTRLSSTTTAAARFSFSLNAEASKGGGKEGSPAEEPLRLERASISGVSVSKKGFHALLDTSRGTVPLAITRDPQDSYAATSPESLTLIQLLSGVDMAGAILPPETLSKMAVFYCEMVPEVFASPSQRAVVEYVQESLPSEITCFAEAHPWIQSRVKLPQVTLDQLDLIYDGERGDWTCRFECAMKGEKWSNRMTMDVTPEIVMPVSYKYEPDTSSMFTCLCLALRYKAPIVVQNLQDVPIPSNLDDDFPQRTTVQNLQSTSTRVAQNIERGFEVHTLTKALQIAMEKGDEGAVERIRAKLDEYDSMDDLPTTPEGSDQTSKKGTDIDDLDENILQ